MVTCEQFKGFFMALARTYGICIKRNIFFCIAFSACAVLLIAITEFKLQRQQLRLERCNINDVTHARPQLDNIKMIKHNINKISSFALLIYQNVPMIALFINTNWFKTSEKNWSFRWFNKNKAILLWARPLSSKSASINLGNCGDVDVNGKKPCMHLKLLLQV